MISFDLARRYQFGFFFAPRPQPIQVDGARAAELLARQPHGAPQFAVRLNRLSTLQQLVPGAAGNQLVQVLSYSGPPVWRVDFSPLRADLHVDALGYEETAERALALDEVRRRIVPNFPGLLEHLQAEIARLVLVVTLQGTVPEGVQIVAQQFFSPEIREAVTRGACNELTARTNLPTEWQLAGRAVPVNRIETAEVAAVSANGRVQRTLSWQLDVNTQPEIVVRPSPAEIEAFFSQAVEWANERIAEIQSW